MTTLEGIAAIGAAAGTMVVAILVQWNAVMATRQRTQEADAARKFAALQTQRTIEIHSLVNSFMGKTLRSLMFALQKIADTSKDPRDILIADQARQDYDQHMANQQKVDDSKKSFDAGVASEKARINIEKIVVK